MFERVLKFSYATIARHVRGRRSIRVISITRRCSSSNCYDASSAAWLRHSHLLPSLQLRTSTAPIICRCKISSQKIFCLKMQIILHSVCKFVSSQNAAGTTRLPSPITGLCLAFLPLDATQSAVMPQYVVRLSVCLSVCDVKVPSSSSIV